MVKQYFIPAGTVIIEIDAEEGVSVKPVTPGEYKAIAGVRATGTLLVQETHVFALVGQSNMVGRPTYDGLGDYPAGTLQWDQTRNLIAATSPLDHVNEDAGDMGLSITFVVDYLAANPNTRVVLVPLSRGGSGFSNGYWTPPSQSLYTAAVSSLNELFAENPSFQFKGFLWHQGEADTGISGTYAGLLDGLISSLRTNVTVADETTPFVVGGLISSGTSAIDAILQNTPTRVPYTAYASASGLTLFDGLHFNAASLRTLGSRYKTAYDAALLNVPAPPAQVTGLSVTPGNAQNALSWSGPFSQQPITDYRIEVNTGSGWSVVSDGVGTGTTFTHTSLTNGTTYQYRVSAISSNGTGTASTTASGTPVAPAPSGPISVLAFDSGESGLVTASVYTFSGITVAPGLVIVGVVARGTSGGSMIPSSVTLNGAAMTLLGSGNQSNLAGGSVESQHAITFWGLAGVSVTDATIVATMTSGEAVRCGCVAWSIENATMTGVASAFRAGANTEAAAGCVATINVPADGILLAYGNSITTESTTLTGVPTRMTRVAVSPDFWHIAGDEVYSTAQTGKTVTLTIGTTLNRRMLGLLAVPKAV